jgi:endonuclease YncB( thermonuclease family)
MRAPIRTLAAALLAGCAALQPPSFPPGTGMSEVEARLGKPPDVIKSADGDTVWQYPTGPIGQTTYMVRFGADQRAKGTYQALTLMQFAQIRTGMTQDEIRVLLGRPGEISTFSRMNEEVWSYHYQASASDNRIFNVHFDAKTRQVRSTSDQIDELLSPSGHDSSSNSS